MSSSLSNASQSTPAYFALKTGKGQYVVKGAADDFQLSAERDGAILFQMPGTPQTSDGLVLLQTLGGRTQVAAAPSMGVVPTDASAEQAPFLKVPAGDGFALATPDREYWLSVSDEGKLVFSKLNSPGASETFTAEPPPHHPGHGCCGPAPLYPSKTLWNDVGHRTIVEQAISCLRNPWSPTAESKEFIRIWDADADFRADLFKGLLEADYNSYFNDTSGAIPYYTSHFYDPDTGKNYWGDDSPTALQRGSQLFRSSLETYTGRVVSAESAAELLGVALHYFTDLTQPMHASNIANVYGDHPNWPLLGDWRHSNFEDYSELIAKSGKLFENYPRLTVEEMSIDGIGKIEDLYHSIAKASKGVWLTYVKPIYEQKRYVEAWGPEAAQALKSATHMAPVGVAKFLSFWTRAGKIKTT